MAYGLKYTATVVRGSYTDTLSIYQNDYTGSAKKIVNLAALKLGFVGQPDPEEPIVKTQLTITLVDAPDLTYNSDEKGGDWYEFYTQDPLLYKVVITRTASSSTWTLWTGYITPDSWEEDLRYHGTITLTARDNIGHLQDFNFKDYFTDETVTLADIISTASTLVGQTFTFGTYFDQLYVNYNTDSAATRCQAKLAIFYTAAFEDGSIYDAIEQILSVFGATLRYYGYNVFGISCIGYMTSETFGGAVSHGGNTAVFLDNSGHHSLNPCFKEITDKISYDFLDDSLSDVPASEFTPGTSSLDPRTSAAGYVGNDEVSAENIMKLAFNLADTYYVAKTFRVPSSTPFTVKFGLLGGYYRKQYSYDVLPASLSYTAMSVTARYSIRYVTVDGTIYYLTVGGAWSTSAQILTAAGTSDANKTYTEISKSGTTPSYTGRLGLWIYSPTGSGLYSTGRDFACLNGITVEYDITNKTSKHTVTTTNSQLANVKLSRTSEVGMYVGVPQVAPCVKNAIMGGGSSALYGMTGLNKSSDGSGSVRYSDIWQHTHRHLLCVHRDTTSILEGELKGANGRFSDIWWYRFSSGYKSFFLTAGTFNFLTGNFESAILREIGSFTSMFPEYTLNGYTVIIDEVTCTDDADVIWEGDEYLYCYFGDEDQRIYVKGRLITPMTGWSRPKLDAFFSNDDGYSRQESLFSQSSDTSGSWSFTIEIEPDDLNDPTRHYTEMEIGPAAVLVGGEGGPEYDEVPTYGFTYFYLAPYDEY